MNWTGKDMKELGIEGVSSLVEENEMLRQEVRVAREAGEITAQLVVSQFEQTEEALQRLHIANAQRQAVFDAASQMSIIATDEKGMIIFFNTGAKNLLGYSEAEVVGKMTPLPFHLESELVERGRELSEELGRPVSGLDVFFVSALQGRPNTREWTYVKRDGTQFLVEMSITAVRGPDAAITGVLCAAMDITARKQTEEELRGYQEHLEDLVEERTSDLEAANKKLVREIAERKRMFEQLQQTQQELVQKERLASVGQLAAGVAHEINNPLGTILLFADAMRKETSEGDQKREDLKTIIDETIRCKNIVSGLLNFARQQEVLAQEVDLHALIEEVIQQLQVRREFEGVSIVREFSPSLSSIQADPGQLKQVFVNLLDNAADAMDGRGTITITTRAMDRRQVEINISDTGRGIPEENLSRLFTPFFTTKPMGKGTGLGLSIVYGIIKVHRGQISVHSQVGQGTTFTVTLPMRYSAGPSSREETPSSLIG
jgi:PAS domain S-box-containing protein